MIRSAIEALLSSAGGDNDHSVILSVEKSMIDLCRSHPKDMLSVCCETLRDTSDATKRGAVLRIVETTMREVVSETDEEGIRLQTCELVSLIIKDVTQRPTSEAGSVLVGAASCFPDVVINALLERCEIPGEAPPIKIVDLLGNVAATNPVVFETRAKEVFSVLLPTLGTIKSKQMRISFSQAFGQFCDAINVAKEQSKAPPKNFNSEALTAYQVIYGNWLGDSAGDVRGAAAEALGRCSLILNLETKRQQLGDTVRKLIQLLNRARGKTSERLMILRGLSSHLSNISAMGCEEAENILLGEINIILEALYPLASNRPTDENDSTILRRDLLVYAEVLRCVEALASGSGKLLGCVQKFLINVFGAFILPGAKQFPPESAIIATCTLLAHLVNSLGKTTANTENIENLLSSVRSLTEIGDINNEREHRRILSPAIRLAVAQLISACGTAGFLQTQDGNLRMGARPAILFILRQCSIAPIDEENNLVSFRKGKGGRGCVSLSQLRNACDNVLLHVSRCTPCPTVTILLPAVISPEYQHALAIIVHCLATLHSNGIIDYNDPLLQIPKKSQLMARLMVAANAPLTGRCRKGPLRDTALKLLQLLSHRLSPEIKANALIIPSCSPKGEKENNFNVSQPGWRQTLFARFRGTLAAAEKVNPQWVTALGLALAEQLSMYSSVCKSKDKEGNYIVAENSVLKSAGIRYLGAVAAASGLPELVTSIIESGLNSIDHSDMNQVRACAVGIGMSASGSRAHLDTAIGLLGKKLRIAAGSGKKVGGWFGFGGKVEGKDDALRGSIAICYGQVAFAAPKCIRSNLLNPTSPLLQLTDKTTTTCPKLRENFLRSLSDIAAAAGTRGNNECFELAQREQFIDLTLSYMQCDKNDKKSADTLIDIRDVGAMACLEMMKLHPMLSGEIHIQILSQMIHLWNLPWKKISEENEPPRGDIVDIIEMTPDPQTKLFAEGSSYNKLLQALVTQIPQELFHEKLSMQIKSENRRCRLRSMNALYEVLLKTARQYNVGIKSIKFAISKWAATLIPRCFDSMPAVRAQAARACCALLDIAKHEANITFDIPKEDKVSRREMIWVNLVLSESTSDNCAGVQLIAAAFADVMPFIAPSSNTSGMIYDGSECTDGKEHVTPKEINPLLCMLQSLLAVGIRDCKSCVRVSSAVALLVILTKVVKSEAISGAIPSLVQDILKILGEVYEELEEDETTILDVDWYKPNHGASNDCNGQQPRLSWGRSRIKAERAKSQKKSSYNYSPTEKSHIQQTKALLHHSILTLANSYFEVVVNQILRSVLPLRVEATYSLAVLVGAPIEIGFSVVRGETIAEKWAEETGDTNPAKLSVPTKMRTQMVQKLIEHLTDILNNVKPISETSEPSSDSSSSGKNTLAGMDSVKKISIEGAQHLVHATYNAFSAVYLLPSGILNPFTSKHLVPLVATLLLGISCIHCACSPPKTKNITDSQEEEKQKDTRSHLLFAACASLRCLIDCAKAGSMRTALLNSDIFEKLCSIEEYDEAIAKITEILCLNAPSVLRNRDKIATEQIVSTKATNTIARSISKVMSIFVTRSNNGQRIAATVCCAAAVPHIGRGLKEPELEMLLTRVTDDEHLARKHAIRGIGASFKTIEVLNTECTYPKIIKALEKSVNDPFGSVQCEGLLAIEFLTSMLPLSTLEKYISSILDSCCETLTVLSADTRCATLQVWAGLLAKFGSTRPSKRIIINAMNVLPNVLAHLRARHAKTRRAALKCLSHLFVVMGNDFDSAAAILVRYGGEDVTQDLRFSQDHGIDETKGIEVPQSNFATNDDATNDEISDNRKEVSDFDACLKEIIPKIILQNGCSIREDLVLNMISTCRNLMLQTGNKSRTTNFYHDQESDIDADTWAPIAANAAMIAASIVTFTPEHKRKKIHSNEVCADISKLLINHPSAPARSRAAQALGLLGTSS